MKRFGRMNGIAVAGARGGPAIFGIVRIFEEVSGKKTGEARKSSNSRHVFEHRCCVHLQAALLALTQRNPLHHLMRLKPSAYAARRLGRSHFLISRPRGLLIN
jgi:hypothetical protein